MPEHLHIPCKYTLFHYFIQVQHHRMTKKSTFGMPHASKDEGTKFAMVTPPSYIVNRWGENCIRKTLFRHFGPLLDGYLFSLSGIFLVTLTRICTDDVFGTDYFQKLGLTKIE